MFMEEFNTKLLRHLQHGQHSNIRHLLFGHLVTHLPDTIQSTIPDSPGLWAPSRHCSLAWAVCRRWDAAPSPARWEQVAPTSCRSAGSPCRCAPSRQTSRWLWCWVLHRIQTFRIHNTSVKDFAVFSSHKVNVNSSRQLKRYKSSNSNTEWT